MSVIGVVGQQDSVKSPSSSVPPEKKQKKDKLPSKAKKSSDSSSTDSKIAELDSKWSERFNRLEALLLSKSLQLTFSSEVKVAPLHSTPANIPRDSEPFFQPTERTGEDFSAEMHQPASRSRFHTLLQQSALAKVSLFHSINQPASQLTSDRQKPSSSKRTGKGSSATLHQPASQLVTDRPTSRSPQRRTGTDTPALKQKSTSQPSTDRNRPPTSELSSTDPSSLRQKSTGKHHSKPHVDRPASTVATNTGSPSLHRPRKDGASSVASGTDSDMSDLYAEEGELSDDPDLNVMEPDQMPTEEQTYRETMRGIRSYMGWSDIPDIDSTNTASDDNPFSGPKAATPGKVSIQMPTEDWLCKKVAKLNLTLVEGYPSRSSEAGGLLMDQFLRTAELQSKWYGLSSDYKADPAAVSNWSTDSSKLNSCYSRIARQSGLTSTPPASRRISQEALRRWEKSAREATFICNQAASFNRCLFKVQQDMQNQLRNLRVESKGKGSSKSSRYHGRTSASHGL